MPRRRGFGEKLARELIGLAFMLVLILVVIMYGYPLLQDTLNAMFLDAIGTSPGQ